MVRKHLESCSMSAEGGNLFALFIFVRGCSPCLSVYSFLFAVYHRKQCKAFGFAVNIAVKGFSSSVKNVLLSVLREFDSNSMGGYARYWFLMCFYVCTVLLFLFYCS
jgi:hypothetical protein